MNRIERELRQRLADWRELLHRQTAGARQIISQLLDGRIVCTPNEHERLYTFTGRVKFDELLSGVVPTVGLVRIRGSSWNSISAFLKAISALRAAV